MNNKKIYGLFLMVIAIFILISNWFTDLFGSFKIIVWSIIFLFFLVRGLIKSSWLMSSISAFLLINMYNEIYHFLPFSTGVLIVILIIFFIGYSLFFGKMQFYPNKKIFIYNGSQKYGDVNTSFSSETKYINDKEIEKFTISTTFSESKLYFDNADLKNDSAVFDVEVKLGNVTLFVPRNWEVINELRVVMGEVKQNPSNDFKTKKVYLRGKVSLGTIQIIYI